MMAMAGGVRAPLRTWAAMACCLVACSSGAYVVASPSPTSSESAAPTPSVIAQPLSQGTSTLRGTFMFDFEKGAESAPGSADVWWEQVDSVRRYLSAQNGTLLARMGFADWGAASAELLARQKFSPQPLDGSNSSNNSLTHGTVVAFKTRHGHLGKFRVDTYGYNLGITWVTYG